MLCVPAALEAMAGLVPGGWPEVRARNRSLALAGQAILCSALGVAPPDRYCWIPRSPAGSLSGGGLAEFCADSVCVA